MSSLSKSQQGGDAERGVYAQVQTHDTEQNHSMGSSPVEGMPTLTGMPLIEVMAPATLPEGYQFEAKLSDHKTFTVTVPQGGVEVGQKFFVPLPEEKPTSFSTTHAPVGHWKDGLCDCWRFGCCHVSCWNAYCCTLVAAGQVLTRLQLTWNANPATTATQASRTFYILLGVTVLYWTLYAFLYIILVGLLGNVDNLDPEHSLKVLACVNNVKNIYGWSMIGFTFYVIFKLRRHMRAKYAIPENSSCPSGCEDAACVCCCGCCALSQMMRHTADYDTYHGTCCTPTGLPNHVLAVV